MIDGRAPFFTITCDFCPNDETFEADSFNEFIELKKEAGWKSVKEDDEWADKCPSCCEEKKSDEVFDFKSLK